MLLALLLQTSWPTPPPVLLAADIPDFDWRAGLLVLGLVGGWLLSNLKNLQAVADLFGAGRRRRDAEVDKCFADVRAEQQELKNKTDNFVGEKKLTEQFQEARDRTDKLAHLVKVMQDAQHSAQTEHEKTLSEVRRNRNDIEKLQALDPRLTEAEKNIALIVQRLGGLEKGQDEIKGSLKTAADERHHDSEKLLQAIKELKNP